MKTSSQLKLVLMGGASALLIGCGDEPTEALIFMNLEDCLKSPEATPAACSTSYRAALAQHEQTAPRYTTQNDCLGEFAACQQIQSGGGSWFIPMMAGFMAARLLDQDRDRDYHYGYSSFGGGRYHSQPLYRTLRDADWSTGDNRSVGSGWGKVKIESSKTWAPKQSKTLSRGGFGSMASARGSWGFGG